MTPAGADASKLRALWALAFLALSVQNGCTVYVRRDAEDPAAALWRRLQRRREENLIGVANRGDPGNVGRVIDPRGRGIHYLLIVCLLSSACTRWYEEKRTVDGTYEPDRIPRARVTLRDGTAIDLLEARIDPDSVVGTEPHGRARRAISVKEIAAIDSKEFSVLQTTALIVGVGVALLLYTFYQIASDPDY